MNIFHYIGSKLLGYNNTTYKQNKVIDVNKSPINTINKDNNYDNDISIDIPDNIITNIVTYKKYYELDSNHFIIIDIELEVTNTYIHLFDSDRGEIYVNPPTIKVIREEVRLLP